MITNGIDEPLTLKVLSITLVIFKFCSTKNLFKFMIIYKNQNQYGESLKLTNG